MVYVGATLSPDLPAILQTIKDLESGNYTSEPYGPGGASGAYQFEPGTWKGLTKEFGVGQQYPIAAEAPPAVQDQVASDYVQQILQQNGNQVGVIPLVWYTGNPQGNISASALAANHGLEPSTYQAHWLATYSAVSGSGVATTDTPGSQVPTQQATLTAAINSDAGFAGNLLKELHGLLNPRESIHFFDLLNPGAAVKDITSDIEGFWFMLFTRMFFASLFVFISWVGIGLMVIPAASSVVEDLAAPATSIRRLTRLGGGPSATAVEQRAYSERREAIRATETEARQRRLQAVTQARQLTTTQARTSSRIEAAREVEAARARSEQKRQAAIRRTVRQRQSA